MRNEIMQSQIIDDHKVCQLLSDGYMFLKKTDYQAEKIALHEQEAMKQVFYGLKADAPSGGRQRSYLKLIWNRNENAVTVARDQRYFQTEAANNLDGGHVREFPQVDLTILNNVVFKKILENNLKLISNYSPLKSEQSLFFGIHFIRYNVVEHGVSFSSPVWLHVDDEPLVFVHLIDLSANAIGGDNLIADASGNLKHAFRLQDFMDTVVLNRKVMHAVTPLGSQSSEAHRDIILFTVEPAATNQW